MCHLHDDRVYCTRFHTLLSRELACVDCSDFGQPPIGGGQCGHLGIAVAEEPCSCGSAIRISIHACHSPDRVRSWQDHAWCVPLSLNWDRLADPLARTSFQCCESCPHLTVNV